MSRPDKYLRAGAPQATGNDPQSFSVDEKWVRYQTGTVPAQGSKLCEFPVPPNLTKRSVWIGGKSYAADNVANVFLLRGRIVFLNERRSVGEIPFADVGAAQLGTAIDFLGPRLLAPYPGAGSLGNLQSGYSSTQPTLMYRGGIGFGSAWAQVELTSMDVVCQANTCEIWLDEFGDAGPGTTWYLFGARVLSN